MSVELVTPQYVLAAGADKTLAIPQNKNRRILILSNVGANAATFYFGRVGAGFVLAVGQTIMFDMVCPSNEIWLESAAGTTVTIGHAGV